MISSGKVIILGALTVVITIIIYVLSEIIICYYEELPVDSCWLTSVDTGDRINTRWEERIKQVWIFTYTPSEGRILEFGCGNTSSPVNINKRLSDKDKHIIFVSENKQQEALKYTKGSTSCTFDIVSDLSKQELEDAYNAIIVHYDGKEMFQDILTKQPNILFSPSVVILEVDPQAGRVIEPILAAYNFHRDRKYIYMSVWYKKKTDTVS